MDNKIYEHNKDIIDGIKNILNYSISVKKLATTAVVLAAVAALVYYAHILNSVKNKNLIHQANAQNVDQNIPLNKIEFPSFAGLVNDLKSSVVNISVTNVVSNAGDSEHFGFNLPFGDDDQFNEFFKRYFQNMPQQREYSQRGLGSGFIISEDGYIVTNNHVIDKARDIEIVLDNGNKYKADVIGKDLKTDLALLKIETSEFLNPVKFGNSDDLNIGDWVIAIGNPFGLGHTVTAGIVSAKGRILGIGNYDDFIQTDAPINPGNSGGPLFNIRGEVVGIDTAIISGGQGIGFAIPANLATNIIVQIKNTGRVTRGWLGVMIQPITPEIAESLNLRDTNGVLVSDVSSKSPAEKAGVERGDVITRYNGKQITSVNDLTGKVALSKPGSEQYLSLIRGGKTKEIVVNIKEQPDEILSNKTSRNKTESETEKLGITVSELSPQIRNRYNIDNDTGVIILSVQPGTIGAEAGFIPGDIILEINKSKLDNIDDLDRQLSNATNNESILFLIERGQNTFYLGLRNLG